MSTHALTPEPADLAKATWSRAIDWTVVLTVVFTLGILSVLVAGRVIIGVIPVVAALYGVGCWRAARMTAALPGIEARAQQGHLRAVVNAGTGSGFSWIGSGETCVLTVEDGWVRLDGTSPRRWPVDSVALGARPSWWSGRGIELRTPQGSRYLSFVPSGDPAFWGRPIVDGRAMDAMAQALDQQRAVQAPTARTTPPGWYPDPSGRPVLRWWDGATWSEETRAAW